MEFKMKNANESKTNSADRLILTIIGVPESGVAYKNTSFKLYACYNGNIGNTVDATWTYNSRYLNIYKLFEQHAHTARVSVFDNSGTTTITASYDGQQCSVDIKIPSMQIYISPANHTKPYIKPDGSGTWYPISEWNERKNMEIIAGYLKEHLNSYDVDVLLTDIHSSTGQYDGRPNEANEWIRYKDKGLYLALHSNAGAGGGTTARGSVGYYNAIGDAGALALALVDAIDAILPTGSNRSSRTIKGNYGNNIPTYAGNLGELREPEEFGFASVLVEQGFHDNPNESKFLTSNQRLLAETIGDTLVKFYNLKRI